jgi:hypothetical protein
MLLSAASLIQWLAMIKLDSVPHRRDKSRSGSALPFLASAFALCTIYLPCLFHNREGAPQRAGALFMHIIYNVLTPSTIACCMDVFIKCKVCTSLSFSLAIT